MSAAAPKELLVFGFGAAEGEFEGRIGGALERAESGGAVKIVRALFVGRVADSGELEVADLRGGTGGLVAPLLSFRLDRTRRKSASERALDPEHPGVPAELLQQLGELLEPGEAIVAVLVEHGWASVLSEAVSRSGGRPLADEFVPSGDMDDFGRRVLAVSSRWDRRPAASTGRDC